MKLLSLCTLVAVTFCSTTVTMQEVTELMDNFIGLHMVTGAENGAVYVGYKARINGGRSLYAKCFTKTNIFKVELEYQTGITVVLDTDMSEDESKKVYDHLQLLFERFKDWYYPFNRTKKE